MTTQKPLSEQQPSEKLESWRQGAWWSGQSDREYHRLGAFIAEIAALESGLREIQEIASDYESEREITEWDEGARFLASKILAKLRLKERIDNTPPENGDDQ